ncbi:MAG: aromatic acid decarboxylase [Gammaproteobacteria bacterium]|nr:MAG: aromatic acid decarboxylase [Pseudomonadota bacterium]PIE38620.1 MAG: aromatic acid decarboxylase [Gammaproteobacteria bacterium]
MSTENRPAWNKTVTVALTGASGVHYGIRLIECLVHSGNRVYVLVSKAARIVISTETGYQFPGQAAATESYLTDLFGAKPGQIKVFGREDWMAPVASGSGTASTSMVVCPCSMGTLSAIACGASDSLIERAADVTLKERRQLVLVPRETPLSEIHLENMLKLSRMGAVVLPACPGFYHQPESIQGLIDFVVARILGHLGVEQKMVKEWGADRQ